MISCHSPGKIGETQVQLPENQENFWRSLAQICGNTYEGTVVAAPAADTVFKDKKLLMHIRSCQDNIIRIPFIVGNDLSRTWVFTKEADGLLLKHDHRHKDGTADSITFYGGKTSNKGTTVMQFFPADQQTTSLLPAAAGNVWWVELVAGKYFTYNLRRLGTDRFFSIRFDLTKTVAAPAAPWGWQD
ncbi:MAG: hypothetical protein HOP10_05305 [Chitinophagaceae bacterium]|nr:hypothetical protein [Chitinophagaceae bacterium]